jgi:hydroxymethylglutaryl-CoA lyase
MNLPGKVEIVDVAPRDGLQGLKEIWPTDDKVALIEGLRAAGVPRIESTSFVSPKWIPQMADAGEVIARVKPNKGDTQLMALAANEKGYERARDAGVDWLCYVVAATETMCQKNTNMSLADAVSRAVEVIAKAKDAGLKVRGSIGVAFICPYEGEVAVDTTLEIMGRLYDAGADDVVINDTVGRANARHVYELCAETLNRWPDKKLAGHFHDTSNMALVNIFAAMQAGVSSFDAAVGGLGGCPFAPGAKGNVATESVVRLMQSLAIETGIDLATLQDLADKIYSKNNLGRAAG